MADPTFSNIAGNIAEPVLDYGDDGDNPGNKLIVRLGTIESVAADTVADYIAPPPAEASDDEAAEASDSAAKDAEIQALKDQLAAAQAGTGTASEGAAPSDPSSAPAS